MAKKAPEPKIEIPVETPPPAPPDGYKPEEWNALAPEEQAGILDEIQNPEIGGPEDLDEEEIDDGTLAAIAAEGEKPVEPPVVEVAPAAPAEPAPVAPVAPTIASDDELLAFRAVVPDSELPEIDTVPVELQTKLDELDEKYNAGDLQLSEYNRDRDKINRQVVMQNIQAKEAEKVNKAWEKEQMFFLQNRPEYLDNKTIKGQAFFGAFQGAVRMLGKDPKNSHWSGMKLLIEADKAVKEAFGIGKPEVVVPAVKPNPAPLKPPAPLPTHQTLAQVPNAAPNAVEDAFAQIDKLSGQNYEDALSRMNPAQREAYLARV